MGIARTIMLIYDTPLSFWNYAIKHSVRLYNVRPLQQLAWKTPYEMLMGEKPDISALFLLPEKSLCQKKRENIRSVQKD